MQPTPGPKGVITSNMSFLFTRATEPLQETPSQDVSIGIDIASRRLPRMPYLNANSPNIQIARDGLPHFHLDKPSNSMHGLQIRPMLSGTILYLAVTPAPTPPPPSPWHSDIVQIGALMRIMMDMEHHYLRNFWKNLALHIANNEWVNLIQLTFPILIQMEVHCYLNLRTGIFTPPTGGEGTPEPHTQLKATKTKNPREKEKGKKKRTKLSLNRCGFKLDGRPINQNSRRRTSTPNKHVEVTLIPKEDAKT